MLEFLREIFAVLGFIFMLLIIICIFKPSDDKDSNNEEIIDNQTEITTEQSIEQHIEQTVKYTNELDTVKNTKLVRLTNNDNYNIYYDSESEVVYIGCIDSFGTLLTMTEKYYNDHLLHYCKHYNNGVFYIFDNDYNVKLVHFNDACPVKDRIN